MHARGSGTVFSPDGWMTRGGLVDKGRGPRKDRASQEGTKETVKDTGLAQQSERHGEGETKTRTGTTPVG